MAWLGLTCLVFIVAKYDVATCIRLLQVTVPSVIQAGETAILQCLYDLEQEKLYSVKWYKDNVELFRFIPAINPPIATYVVDGILVDERSSTHHKVVLPNVALPSTGHYKCEVSAERPNFASASGGGFMEVIVLPQGKPVITGGQPRYKVGDYVGVNCTSAASKPPAQLSWHVNGKKASVGHLRQYKTVVGTNNLESTVLGLSFRVDEQHVSNSPLVLKCLASVGALHQGAVTSENSRDTFSDLVNHEKIEAQVGWPSLSESSMEVLHIANGISRTADSTLVAITLSCILLLFSCLVVQQ